MENKEKNKAEIIMEKVFDEILKRLEKEPEKITNKELKDFAEMANVMRFDLLSIYKDLTKNIGVKSDRPYITPMADSKNIGLS